ncbi:hypothetical protein GCM10008119_36150 [Pedobacter mendelii]|uniref:Uncharacterized protein n=1 Tax=Pedobacter mendelii TaxID=1908240 RepID=A0ABQ2BLK5_9SPHI|nr:hypothetical protein GCM10008119_36150 [Pedobacter mendelii]
MVPMDVATRILNGNIQKVEVIKLIINRMSLVTIKLSTIVLLVLILITVMLIINN